MYSATRNDRNNDDNEIVTVHGVRGILVNKREIEAFQGPIPLNEYPINEDPNPEIIKEPYEVPINTRQDVTVRFLEPPIQPPHGEIVIKYEKPIIPPPPPPLVIRSVPPLKSQPLEPLIIREAPPKIAQPLPPKVIKVLPPKVPPPPRRVIIQKYPPIDDRPRTVIIERWLAPKPQPRRVVVDGYVDVAKLKAAPVRNQIIEYEAPKANLTSEIKDTTVVRADPNQYVSQHRSNLYDPKDLPEIAKQVRPPPGYILASDVAASNQTAPLEGEIEALKRIDLDKEGLSEYKVFLFKSGQQSTTTSTTTVTPVGDRYNPNTTTTTTTTSTAGSGNNSGPNSTIGALVIDSARNPYAGPSPNNGSGYNQQQQPQQQPPPNGSGDTTRIITVASSPSYQVRTATVTSTTTPNNSPDSSSNGAGYYQSQRYTYSYRAENNSSL